MKILKVYTCNNEFIGGISTMINSYIGSVNIFNNQGCMLNHFNCTPKIQIGNSKVDNFIYIFTQRREIKKYLSKNKYDLIHIHTSREFLYMKDVLLAKMINKKFQTPVVMTIHVGAIETVYNRIKWFKKRSIKLLNKYVSKTIFLSSVMRDVFVESGLLKEKSTVLYNFYDFTPTTKIYTKTNKLQLLFVGAIHREKGILELLKAIELLPDLNYHLNVCGKLTDNTIKEEIEYYKKKLCDKVSFLGYVTGENKTLLYKQSDILILPSYHEGLPIVIMEALGAGCGIMTTPVGAIPEILKRENCRWLEIGSYMSIVKQLSNLSNDDLSKMKEANILLGEKYTLASHINRLCNIYNSVKLFSR